MIGLPITTRDFVPHLFSQAISNLSRKIPATLLSIGLALPCAGCEKPAVSGVDTFQLQTRLNAAESEISDLKSSVAQLATMRRDAAWLTPTETEYSLLDSDVGRFAVSVEKIAPLGNGSEATLKFGNMTGVSVISLKYHIAWGPVDAKGNMIAGDQHNADRTIAAPLYSGSWNTIKVPLADVPPTKLGFMIVSGAEATRITLTPR